MNKSLIIFGIVNITSDSFSDGGYITGARRSHCAGA